MGDHGVVGTCEDSAPRIGLVVPSTSVPDTCKNKDDSGTKTLGSRGVEEEECRRPEKGRIEDLDDVIGLVGVRRVKPIEARGTVGVGGNSGVPAKRVSGEGVRKLENLDQRWDPGMSKKSKDMSEESFEVPE